jgi:protocatechuate 3,4-dioxygenase alpha subunit
MPKQSPSQTVGPFFSYCLSPEAYGRNGIASNQLTLPTAEGQRIIVEGVITDGEHAPVSDALVEIWQANAAGRYNHPVDNRGDVALDPAFKGFGRSKTDNQGLFHFETIKPGRVPGQGNTLQAPHIGVIVFARGMSNHVFTRLYFADEADANAKDPVLSSIEAKRRKTLVAEAGEQAGSAIYRFNIHLQGDEETVFFDA